MLKRSHSAMSKRRRFTVKSECDDDHRCDSLPGLVKGEPTDHYWGYDRIEDALTDATGQRGPATKKEENNMYGQS